MNQVLPLPREGGSSGPDGGDSALAGLAGAVAGVQQGGAQGVQLWRVVALLMLFTVGDMSP